MNELIRMPDSAEKTQVPENRGVSQIYDIAAGDEIFALAAEIYPICRSITGNGVRETLRILGRYIDIFMNEVPTGTEVFDWTVPPEWNIRSAHIKDAGGQTVVDFADLNLHVMSYSIPVRKHVTLSELRSHIHSLPEQPDVVPYRTSYYSQDWGFCMTHRQVLSLRDETYEVMIDSTLDDGYLTYGEYLKKGESDEEVLLSAHICHPSLANDNCSGIALLTYLASRISTIKTRYSYRFIFAPGTIGSIAWLALNERIVSRIKHGLVVSMVGDGGGPTYKKSRRGDARIDQAVGHVLRHSGLEPTILDFSPYGYDERQYCSPAFNLPVGLFQRSMFGAIPQYHTSADNLDFIRPEHLAQSYRLIVSTLDVIENDLTYLNTNPKCEPQLGRRGLYAAIGGTQDIEAGRMAMLWVLNLSDGIHSLLDIAARADLPFATIRYAADMLRQNGLLIPRASSPGP
jgi:aminopeptidase-like protein